MVQPKQQRTTNISSHISQEQEDDGKEGWICGRGVATRTNKNIAMQCFCPPSLYGEYCQYFSDRVPVIVGFRGWPPELLEETSNAIKILALLLMNDAIIDHYVFHLPLILSDNLNRKFRFNLIYQRPKTLLKSYIVRFEAYHFSSDSFIKFLGVWEYSIHFPFLPSYRLAQVLQFQKQQTSVIQAHICQTSNLCLQNSKCYPIMNQINNISAYYCYCNMNTFGQHCEHLLPSSSSLICSKHALLRPLSSFKSLCLCPIHLYGPTCYINHTCVNRNPCDINRGKCYVNPDNMTRDYICVCDKKFFGDHCEIDSAAVKMNFIDLSFIQLSSEFILSSIIQLCDLDNKTLGLLVREKYVYHGLPPVITEFFHNNYYLPKLGILKLYHKSNNHLTNLRQAKYFILYIIPWEVSRLNLTAVINKTNYCPHTAIVFQKNLSDISDLSQVLHFNGANLNSAFNISTMIFKYHLLCNPPYSLMCFHDDNYFCLCDVHGRAECSRYDSTLDECGGRCRAGGQCIRGNLDNQKDFVCLCPRCYHGSVCQHNTELFSFTLETLLTNDLYSPSVIIRRLFFSLLIVSPVILFLAGAMNNICCYATFNRPKPLSVGTGHYLRVASVINQLTLFLLVLKFIHIVISIHGYIAPQMINAILCKVLSYLLSCTSRMSYWLMGMVAIERVYVTWWLRDTWLKSPRIAKRIMTSIIVGTTVLNIHEVIYYQSIEDPKSLNMNNSTWCVTSYPSIIATYNQVNIILNYIMPFLINIFSTIILMSLITRKRATATIKKTKCPHSQAKVRSAFRSYMDLFAKNKELIFAPLMTMLPELFSLPQFILSFSLACQEFNVNWQRYLLIISYFVTYLPQVLSYKLYISPSTFYTNEFHATKLSEQINKWRKLLISKRAETTSTEVDQTLTKF